MTANEFTAFIVGVLAGLGWAWVLAEHGFIKTERLEHWGKLYEWRKSKPKFQRGDTPVRRETHETRLQMFEQIFIPS